MMTGDETMEGGTVEIGETNVETAQDISSETLFQKESPPLLEVIEGPSKGKSVIIVRRVLVGRHADCDLRLDDKATSKHHLRIERKGGKFVATALNKNNPVLLGSKPVKSSPLKSGDVLRLGESALRVVTGDGQPLEKKHRRGKASKVFYVLLLLLVLGVGAVALKYYPLLENASEPVPVYQQPDTADVKAAEESKQQAWEIREKLSPLFTEANVLYATKDYAKAKEVLLKARELAPDNEDVNRLMADIGAALVEQQEVEEKQAVAREKAMDKMKHSYAKAMLYRDENQPYRALREFQYLLSLNVASEETTAAERIAEELEKMLLEKTRPDFEKGEKLLDRGKPRQALEAWNSALEVFPDHKEIKARIEKLMPAIAQQGKELYQEGLVYEDLGRKDQAVKKWKEAVDILSIVPESEYLEKAKTKLAASPSS